MRVDWYGVVTVLSMTAVTVVVIYGLYRIFCLMWQRNKKQALRAHLISVLIDHNFREEMQFRVTTALERHGVELTFEQVESDALTAIAEDIYPEVLVRTGLSAERLTRGTVCLALRNEWERIKITSSLDYYGDLQLESGLD